MSKIFSYLPVIYVKSNITKMLSSSLDLGLEYSAEYLADVILQLNPYAVTWGLSYWEKEYDITPLSGDTFDIRKARVLAFFNKDNRYSTKGIQDELKRMYNLESNISADCENYIVNITLDYLFGMNHSAIYEYLKAVLPAHLLLKIVIILTTQKTKIYCGNLIVSKRSSTIKMNSHNLPLVEKLYVGKTTVRHIFKTIYSKVQKSDVTEFDGFN